jgi:hypothetical protein
MTSEPHEVRYSSGQLAMVGDRVIDDVWQATVEAVVVSPAQMAEWGVHEPGLMLITDGAGRVFEPCSSVGWSAVELQSRGEAS